MNSRFIYRLFFGLCIFSLFTLPWLSAQDVTRFRGSEGSSFYSDPALNPYALASGATILWQASLAKGYSGVSIQGNRLYSMGNDRVNDTVWCLNADTGAVIWKYSYRCSTNEHPGPRATPAIDNDTVYTLSLEGHLFAFNAYTGQVKWQKNLVSDFGARLPSWALGSSVVISGDMLLVNANRSGIALDKNTGAKIWASQSAQSGYATPVLFTVAGVKCAAFFGSDALYGVELATGRVLWQYNWRTSNYVNAADPLIFGDKIFISTGYGRGCALFEFDADSISLLWENTNLASHFTSPVIIDGVIYGITGNTGSGTFRALDAGTGAILLNQRVKFGNFIVVNGTFLIIFERGELTAAQVTKNSYSVLSSASLKPGIYWTPPVISGGRVYIRNENGDLYCISMR